MRRPRCRVFRLTLDADFPGFAVCAGASGEHWHEAREMISCQGARAVRSSLHAKPYQTGKAHQKPSRQGSRSAQAQQNVRRSKHTPLDRRMPWRQGAGKLGDKGFEFTAAHAEDGCLARKALQRVFLHAQRAPRRGPPLQGSARAHASMESSPSPRRIPFQGVMRHRLGRRARLMLALAERCGHLLCLLVRHLRRRLPLTRGIGSALRPGVRGWRGDEPQAMTFRLAHATLTLSAHPASIFRAALAQASTCMLLQLSPRPALACCF